MILEKISNYIRFISIAINMTMSNYLYDNYQLFNIKKISYDSSNIYHLNNKSNKIIIFISGSYVCGFHSYIKKTLKDLYDCYLSIISEYDIYVFENTTKANFMLYSDIVKFVNEINSNSKIDELIFFGYSYGATTCSNALANLKNLNCKKKLITYDAPHSPYKIFKHIKESNILADYYFNKLISDQYPEYINPAKTIDDLVDIISKDYNITNIKCLKLNTMNYDLDENDILINIYSKYDIITSHENNIRNSFKKYESKIKFKYYNIEKDNTSHCTDHVYNTSYLDNIINAIQL